MFNALDAKSSYDVDDKMILIISWCWWWGEFNDELKPMKNKNVAEPLTIFFTFGCGCDFSESPDLLRLQFCMLQHIFNVKIKSSNNSIFKQNASH